MTKKQNIAGLEVFSCLPDTPTSRPDLLFIHGAFAGAWMWTETYMPYFAAAGYPCHALSLRGHGGSDGHDRINWLSVADYVDDVRMVIEALAIDPVLLGHSMGGFVVQKYLERHAAPAVALLCSVPPQGLIAAQFHLLLQKPQLYLEINRILAGNYTETDTLKEALFAGEVDQKMLEVWLGRMQNESQRAIWDMSMFNLPNLYCMQKVPMLIVGAEMDALVPAFLAQSTAHTYGEPCHILRGMGHAITHEKDWSKGAALVLNWLETLKP
jgi:pimeloyl-ACP methyl ester carboxylesterase